MKNYFKPFNLAEGEKMENLEKKILENEYKKRKLFPLYNTEEKEYLKSLRFHLNLSDGNAIHPLVKVK